MKSIQHTRLVLPIFLILLSGSIIAQTAPPAHELGNEDITVIKEYQPVLNDAFKINIQPAGDTTTVETTPLQYSVDPAPVNSNYTLSPIKPVRIKDDNIRRLYHGFIKAGYGLDNMPLLDVYYNSLRSKKVDGGFSFHHLSATGKINHYGSPAFSDNNLTLFGNSYFDKFKLQGNLVYERNLVHYYGFNSPPDLYSKAETRHLMNTIGGDFTLSDLSIKEDEIKYNAGLNFYSFSDNRKSNESNFGIKLGAVKAIGPGKVKADIITDFMSVDQPLQKFNRSLIRVQPHYLYDWDLLALEGGLNIAVDGADHYSAVRIYPYLHAGYQVIKDVVSVFTEISGDVDRNDLREFSRQNPFLGEYVRLENSNRKFSVSGGTSIKPDRNIAVTASARYSRILEKPFFINLHDSAFPVTFTTIYEDVNELLLKAAIEYKTTEKFSVMAAVEVKTYNARVLEHPFYSPAVRFNINAQYAIAEKIFVKADVFTVSKQYALAEKPGINYITLKGYADANLAVDYRYTKLLSVFLQLNNLGFSQYSRYYKYPSYRLTGLAGATLSF